MDSVTKDVAGEVIGSVTEAAKQGGPFRSKDDPRRYDIAKARKGEKKERPPKTTFMPPKDPEAPEELILAWHVLSNDVEWDKTPAQKNMRKAYDAGPLAFRKHYREVEAQWEKSKSGGGGVGSVESGPDAGTDKCVELCLKLIKEIGNESGAKKAS